MTRASVAVFVAFGLMVVPHADAQEWRQPGSIDVTLVPAGGLFFTEATDAQEPGFGNYGLGAAVAIHINRFVAVEGEIGGALGVSQDLQFGDLDSGSTPNMLAYSGSLVFSVPTRSALVPYAAGGVGGLSLFEEDALGIDGTHTFLTGNVGGGLMWHAGRWGLRGDYRFVPVRSKDDAPEFFGQQTRYGHRVYGAVVLNVR
jgi:hypothetical protein